MAADTPQTPVQIEKAQVSQPAPGVRSRFSSVGSTKKSDKTVSWNRRRMYDIYYAIYRQHPMVRAAIDKIAKSATANGYYFSPEDPETDLPKLRNSKLKKFFRKSNGKQLIRALVRDLFIYGEAFVHVQRAGRGASGTPIKMMRLHPKHLDVVLNKSKTEISGWEYGDETAGSDAQKYKAHEVIQFKFDDPDDDIRGLSPLESVAAVVAQDLFAIDYNSRFFENSAQTGVIFNMKNATQDEIERNREWLKQEYSGSANAHKPLLLEGEIEVETSVAKQHEMEFVAGRKLNRQDILAVLDVQHEKLGITETSNRSVGREQDNSFREETVAPVQSIFEEGFNNGLLLDMFGYDNILFRMRKMSMRDMLEAMSLWTEGLTKGVFSINHIKGEIGLPDIPGGDEHFVQTAAGLIPVQWIDDVAARLISVEQINQLFGPHRLPSDTGDLPDSPHPLTGEGSDARGAPVTDGDD